MCYFSVLFLLNLCILKFQLAHEPDSGAAGGSGGRPAGDHHAAGKGPVQPFSQAGGGHFPGRRRPHRRYLSV